MADLEYITLKEYIETKIHALEKQMEIKFDSINKATQIAITNNEKRLEGMNEFREQLENQSSTFITRNEHEIINKQIVDDIRSLRESRAELQGKASQNSVFIGYIISIVAIIISIITYFIKQ
jgi:hypothetical protein